MRQKKDLERDREKENMKKEQIDREEDERKGHINWEREKNRERETSRKGQIDSKIEKGRRDPNIIDTLK